MQRGLKGLAIVIAYLVGILSLNAKRIESKTIFLIQITY
jgi:hypothetical protein